MKNNTKKVKRKVSLIFIIFAVMLIFSFIFLEKVFLGNQAKSVSLQNAVNKTKERQEFFKSFLARASTSLVTVGDSKAFKQFIAQKTSDSIEDMQDLFMIVTKTDPAIMQLRYIDKNGQEQIRIDRNEEDSNPYFIAAKDLQNKADRYYFSDSKNRALDKVWFSAIDLNIEHGKIDIPYRPTLRAVLPISDKGQFNGILIINYFMQGFLDKFLNAPLYDMILADGKGYTLKHYDRSKNWGYYQKEQYTIYKDFPNYAQTILSQNVVEQKGFVSRKLDLPIEGGLVLILQLKHSYAEDTGIQKVELYLSVIAIVLFFASVASIFLSSSIGRLYQELNKKLERSQLKFFTLFRESLDPIVLVDVATQKFVEYNQRTLEFYGYSKEEFEKLRVQDLDTAYNEEEIRKHQEQLIKNGWDKFTTKHRTKNGQVKDINVSVVTIMLDEKLYLYGTFHDITKDKEYEASLTKLINQQQALMKVKTTGFVHLKNRHFLWTNEVFEQMFGYEKGEMQGADVRIVYPDAEAFEAFGRDAYAMLESSGTYACELDCVRKDGSAITIHVSLTALKETEHEALGVVIDITKEKEQQKLIQNQKDELEAIFTTSKDGIAILDLDTSFLDCNEAYLEMTGFTKEELLQKSCIGLTAPEDYELAMEVAELVQTQGFVKSFNKTCIVHNGKRLYVNMSASLMPDKKRVLLMAKDITDMKRYEEKLEHIAHYDALTGLPNRVLQTDRLNQAMLHVQRKGGYIAVVYLDLDGFKEVNDTYGHEMGDKVLVSVSSRMKQVLRVGDTLSRLGGDEFVAIISYMEQKENAQPILDRLLQAASDPILIGQLSLNVSASIGVAFYSQEDKELDGDQLIRQADQAMYAAKQSGKNRYHIFNTES